MRPPVGTSLRSYAEGIADQLFAYRYPKHPDFTEKIAAADLRHTLTLVTEALGQPNGRLENVEATMRRVLTRVAGPLRLGTMFAAHFVVDLQHWLDLIDRRRSESGTITLTVGVVRSWLDGADTPADRRGLTPEVADVVILSMCAATDRSVVDGGRTVTRPEIGRLRPDWELRAQELPDEGDWALAIRRAKDLGIMPASELRSATSVADLNERIHADVVGDRADSVRALVPALSVLSSVTSVPNEAPRVRTALAAVTLVTYSLGCRRRSTIGFSHLSFSNSTRPDPRLRRESVSISCRWRDGQPQT